MTFGGPGPEKGPMTCDFWGALGRELRRDFWVLGLEGRGVTFGGPGPGERAVTCDFWGAWAGRKGRDDL